MIMIKDSIEPSQMVIQVYRLDKHYTHDDTREINTLESWSIVMDKRFASIEEASKYVIDMNRKFCAHELGIICCDDENIVAERCTSVDFCHKQRYFIEHPNTKLIAYTMVKDSISIYRNYEKIKQWKAGRSKL